jgi:hypothetical protein
MSRSMIGYGLLLAGLAVGMGCPQRAPRISPPSINASRAGAQAIELFDADKDGKLRGEELNKCPGLKAGLARLDPGGQGVTADAITARIQEWQKTKIARINVGCMVSYNGKPLEGAEVKFVPETFLGPNMKVATGTTVQGGLASISVPTSGDQFDPPGVPPGFYRVEITKAGLEIPAKYNTATVLGREVAYGPQMMEPIRFDLKF